MKIDRLKMCYAYGMPASEFQPNEIEVGLRKVLHIVFDLFQQLKRIRNLIALFWNNNLYWAKIPVVSTLLNAEEISQVSISPHGYTLPN